MCPRKVLDVSEALASARMAAWNYDAITGKLLSTPELKRLLCFERDEELSTDVILKRLLPGERDSMRAAVLGAIAQGRRFFRLAIRIRCFDDQISWFLLRAEVVCALGAIQEVRGIIADLTELKYEEEENAYLAAVVSSTPFAVISVDRKRRIASWNMGAINTFGYTKDEAVGQSIKLIIPDELWEVDSARSAKAHQGETITFETIRSRKNGRTFPAKITMAPVIGPDGAIIGVSSIIEDRTEARVNEDRQALLIRELHHRVRNTLATVQGIAGVTARVSESVEDFTNSFSRRIAALAQTHSRLTEAGHQRVEIAELIELELGPFVSDDRVTLGGPEVAMSSDLAPTFAMIIHELATNATKHGALSTSRGVVDIHWVTKEGRVLVSWDEHGPAREWKSERRGFGTTLLDLVAPAQFGARIERRFAEDGIRIEFSLPLTDQ